MTLDRLPGEHDDAYFARLETLLCRDLTKTLADRGIERTPDQLRTFAHKAAGQLDESPVGVLLSASLIIRRLVRREREAR